MVNTALRPPVAFGVNVTLIVHFARLARLVPQVLDCAKSPGLVPVKLIVPIERAVSKLLVTVTFFAALVVPTVTVPNERVSGLTLTGSFPVPVRAIVCGLVTALSVMFTVAVCLPATTGVNVTVIVQLPPAATLVPQVLV